MTGRRNGSAGADALSARQAVAVRPVAPRRKTGGKIVATPPEVKREAAGSTGGRRLPAAP